MKTGVDLEWVGLNELSVCELNPRKRVVEADIVEMAESILSVGIIQPPTARRRGVDGRPEIVFGQRRYLGALKARDLARERGLGEERVADLSGLWVMMRVMSDRQVVEEAWVENLQRVDVSVREEAVGFGELLALRDENGDPVYSQRSLAERLGKSVAFLSRRLKLGGVPEVLWKALEEGRVSVRHLELVGTIADGKARERAAREILEPSYQAEPLSVRGTMELLERDYRKGLRGVVWDVKSATLVPVRLDKKGNRVMGGSCEDCPHRTGNVPELGEVVATGGAAARGINAWVCLQPGCHRAKEEAHWGVVLEMARDQGLRVLSAEEGEKVFVAGSEVMTGHGSELVILSGRPDYRATGHHGGDDLPTWAELLEGTGFEKDVVLGRHPGTGAVLRLMDRERAIKWAELGMKERGEVSPFSGRPAPRKGTGLLGAGGSGTAAAVDGASGGADGAGVDLVGPGAEVTGLSDHQVEGMTVEAVTRGVLLAVREAVSERDGLASNELLELVGSVLLGSVFELDGGHWVREVLQRLGFGLPGLEEWEGLGVRGQMEALRVLMAEDVAVGMGKTYPAGTHVDGWLVMLVLLTGYEGVRSPAAMLWLKGIGIDVRAMEREAREAIVRADAERVVRERAALAGRGKGRKAPVAAEGGAEKAGKGKKAAVKGKKGAGKGAKGGKGSKKGTEAVSGADEVREIQAWGINLEVTRLGQRVEADEGSVEVGHHLLDGDAFLDWDDVQVISHGDVQVWIFAANGPDGWAWGWRVSTPEWQDLWNPMTVLDLMESREAAVVAGLVGVQSKLGEWEADLPWWVAPMADALRRAEVAARRQWEMEMLEGLNGEG